MLLFCVHIISDYKVFAHLLLAIETNCEYLVYTCDLRRCECIGSQTHCLFTNTALTSPAIVLMRPWIRRACRLHTACSVACQCSPTIPQTAHLSEAAPATVTTAAACDASAAKNCRHCHGSCNALQHPTIPQSAHLSETAPATVTTAAACVASTAKSCRRCHGSCIALQHVIFLLYLYIRFHVNTGNLCPKIFRFLLDRKANALDSRSVVHVKVLAKCNNVSRKQAIHGAHGVKTALGM